MLKVFITIAQIFAFIIIGIDVGLIIVKIFVPDNVLRLDSSQITAAIIGFILSATVVLFSIIEENISRYYNK